MPVIPASQLQKFVTDTLLAVRNGIQAAIEDGLVCQVPKSVDFSVVVVADNELMVAVSKTKGAPDGETVTTEATPESREVSTTERKATRTSKTTGAEDSTGTESGSEKTDSTDTNDQTASENGTNNTTNDKNDDQSDESNAHDDETVNQEQVFGRRSRTEVTYTRF